jgi:hypothetical protein
VSVLDDHEMLQPDYDTLLQAIAQVSRLAHQFVNAHPSVANAPAMTVVTKVDRDLDVLTRDLYVLGGYLGVPHQRDGSDAH